MPKVLLLLLSLVLLAPLAQAAEPDRLSKSLIDLRADVEQLNAELSLLRDESKTTLLGLNAQKAELSAQISRQELAFQKLQESLRKAEESAAQAGVAGDSLTPILLQTMDALASYISNGLPFKTEERLAGLQDVRLQLTNGTLAPPRAANRLWAFFEDELRLTRDSGIYQQRITVDDVPMLADVAKLGTMLLFFRTEDSRYGAITQQGQGWAAVVSTDSTQQKQIAALFEALSRQIRQGYFVVPNALAGGAK